MSNGRREFDMAHSLPTNLLKSHFNTTFFTGYALIFHPFIFSAKTLIILYWSKYSCAKKTISFRFESSIVYRFWFFNFTIGPAYNPFWRSKGNSYFIKRVVELDRSQPEFTLSLHQYLNKAVSANRIKKAKKLYKEKYDLQKNFVTQLDLDSQRKVL